MRGTSQCLLVALLLCIITSAPTARASVGFQPPTADELSLKSEPKAPGAPAIILYRQVDRDDNSRTSHEDNYFRIKVLTEAGRKYANVEIPFVKNYQNVVNVHARTIRPDGSIVDFGGQAFDKELLKARGVKYLAKTFTLPDVQVGGIIEYYYTIDLGENMIFDSHWILSDELFTRRAQFSLKPYLGTYQPFSLRWSWRSLPPGATPTQGADRIVHMTAENIPAFLEEDYMPPPNELKSRVDFIYEAGFAEKDKDAFWRQFGKKRDGLLESFVGKRKAMEQAVSQIVSPNDSPEEKLHKIYKRVLQFRNTSYELHKTEQEEKRDKEKVAENVEDLWKRGYGNSIDLTWLFLGLVRAAGFEAYGCWVSDRQDYFFDAITMESAKLNANVVLVKLNGKNLFFDPGVVFTPFGLLPWSETGVTGMVLNKDGGAWITTTLPPASESRIERTAKLKLSDTGDLEGKVTVRYVGLEAMYHRMMERNSDDVERKKSLEERLTSQIAAASEAELTNKPDWTSADEPLVAEFDLKIPGWASGAGKRVLLRGAVFTAGEQNTFQHTNRSQPVYFNYPYQKVDDVTIELPPGWQVTSVPPEQDLNGKIVVYNAKVEKNASTLHLTRKLTIDALLIDIKFYPALRNFFQAVRNSDGMQIVVQPGEIHASN